MIVYGGRGGEKKGENAAAIIPEPLPESCLFSAAKNLNPIWTEGRLDGGEGGKEHGENEKEKKTAFGPGSAFRAKLGKFSRPPR